MIGVPADSRAQMAPPIDLAPMRKRHDSPDTREPKLPGVWEITP